MEAQDLANLARSYEENRQFITNEETAKMALIVPFLRLLGYDPNSPRECRAEYAAPFTQGDGKRQPDRMDYAIFDRAGERPLFVVEAKPLGSNLRALTNQLARYIAQLPELHFGLITDGCSYLLYGDLDSPNVMDAEPFFSFRLDDPKADWEKTAKFLTKFGRDRFDAESLIADAENSRYRQGIIERLKLALCNPSGDADFLRWLTDGVYTGMRTKAVMDRMGRVAKEAIEPALMAVISETFVEGLRSRLAGQATQATPSPEGSAEADTNGAQAASEPCGGVVTTEDEREFHRIAQRIAERNERDPSAVLARDTRTYFNVSYRRPTRWFLRLFGDGRRRWLVTRLTEATVRQLAPGYLTRASSWGFQVELEEVAQLWGLERLVVASLEALESGVRAGADESEAPESDGLVTDGV